MFTKSKINTFINKTSARVRKKIIEICAIACTDKDIKSSKNPRYRLKPDLSLTSEFSRARKNFMFFLIFAAAEIYIFCIGK